MDVILYELLNGATPFDKQRLRSGALDEMLRIIREEEPPRPSTKLRTIESMNDLASAYQMAGKLDLAVPLYHETLELGRATLGSEYPETGKNAEAVQLCQDWTTLYARSLLGEALLQRQLYDAWQKPDEATRWRKELEMRGGATRPAAS